MRRRRRLFAILVPLPLVALGCSSFLHWSPGVASDVAALCAVTDDVLPALEAIAVEYSVPIEYVEKAFQLACGSAPKDADSVDQGLRAARASAMAAREERARFGGDAGK